jgi:beta-phosphoglucomutase-like phosphatase (HAD superfamily)
VKKYILFDHDGVLVDTEFWYYKAGERALADIGLTLEKDRYLRDINQGLGTWAQASAAGIDEQTISRQREVRNNFYQEYLRTEAIEIEGVVDTLAELSKYVRMAIVTTAKRVDFELSMISAVLDNSWISSLFAKTTSSPSRTRNHT